MTRRNAAHVLLTIASLSTLATSARIRPRVAQAVSSSPTTTGSSASASTTAAPTTTTNVPFELLSIANALISDNYSGQTISNIRTLTWPTTVVIGTHTYTITPKITTSASSTSTPTHTQTTKSHDAAGAKSTSEKATDPPNDQKGDKRLAIILGVVIGCVALAVMGVIFCCLHKRRRDNGSFFLRRTTPSMRSNGSWRSWRSGVNRPDTLGTTTVVTAGPDMFEHKQPSTRIIQRQPTPPLSAHPAFLNIDSSRSTSEENPFYTPYERSATNLRHHELDGMEIKEAGFDQRDFANRRSSHSLRDSTSPEPFSPLVTQMPGPAQRPQVHINPFSSPEDHEAEDTVSPIIPPMRNSERRHSPMVHYPSWDEVSAFSFSGDERDARQEDGGDGWRPYRERRDGRYELA